MRVRFSYPQESVLSEVIAYNVDQRIGALAEGDSPAYAAPTRVYSGEFSVDLTLSRRALAQIDRYLEIDLQPAFESPTGASRGRR